MRGDEPEFDLERLRRLWEQRLRESAEPLEMGPQEMGLCLDWLEKQLLDHILSGWLVQGRVSMRWDGLEGKPKFDAR